MNSSASNETPSHSAPCMLTNVVSFTGLWETELGSRLSGLGK